MPDGIKIILSDGKTVQGQPIREITVDPTSYYADRMQSVKWTLSGNNAGFFTLVFPHGTPFADNEIHSGESKDPKVAERRVIDPAVDRYHYYVAVAGLNGAGETDVFLIAGCPEIIIR
jgi:hypothetical protein